MRLIDKDHMIYRLEQASKYFGGEQADSFDERFSHGLKEASIKVAEETEVQAVPIDVLDKIRAEIEKTTSIYIISRERGGMGQVEWSDRLIKESEVLEIIDKYKAEIEPQESDNCN